MKAEITNAFTIGDLSLTLRTALYARKRNGNWFVHLNYHQLAIKYLAENEEIPLLKEGLVLQVSRDNDWISGICLLLGAVGIAISIVNLIKGILEVLANVSSLIPKLLEWLQIEVTKAMNSQEPTYLTRLNEAQFVLNLMNNGAAIERRLPRWRRRN